MSEIVMWGIEVNGKVHSAEFHKSFAERHIATGNDRNDGFQYKLVPLCRAPLQQETDKDGERYRYWLSLRNRQWECGSRYTQEDRDLWNLCSGDMASPKQINFAIDAAIAALPQKDSEI